MVANLGLTGKHLKVTRTKRLPYAKSGLKAGIGARKTSIVKGANMTNEQIEKLFENPHFQHCMFNFIQAKLQIRVSVEAGESRTGESRVNVSVNLEGQRIDSHSYDYLLGDSDSSSIQ
jgi:wyosine [tRNA(Phe)-imidazoG37] synthetase (radical SAM superfamily)